MRISGGVTGASIQLEGLPVLLPGLFAGVPAALLFRHLPGAVGGVSLAVVVFEVVGDGARLNVRFFGEPLAEGVVPEASGAVKEGDAIGGCGNVLFLRRFPAPELVDAGDAALVDQFPRSTGLSVSSTIASKSSRISPAGSVVESRALVCSMVSPSSVISGSMTARPCGIP